MQLVSSDEDFSSTFGTIRRAVTDSRGVRLVDFVRGLTPVYSRIYRELALGFVALAASVTVAVIAERRGTPSLAVAVAGALVIGFWFFYLVSFVHEGLHGNLARTRRANDLLSGALL